MNILVTGSTGNVGSEVMRALQAKRLEPIAGIAPPKDNAPAPVGSRVVDFMDATTWEPALEGVDKIFLLRPPAISDVRSYLFPFIDVAVARGIKQIVFLSLQGVQFNPLTPHHEVEKYLRRKKAPYTFIRPNFFMQNLTTFYCDDIRERDEIFLPAGRGKTAFVDVRDIGAVVAEALTDEKHIGQA